MSDSNIQTISPQDAANYVDQTYKALGLHAGMMTKPALLKEVYDSEMYLSDFPLIQSRMNDAMAHPASLDPMLQSIRSGIVNRHPAIQAFLGAAIKENLFIGAPKIADVIEKTLHRMFLLEILVQEMIKSPEFFAQLQPHYAKKRRELGISESFFTAVKDVYKATSDPFETAKILTVDNTVTQYLDFRTRTELNADDLKKKNKGLLVNVLEATLADYARGYKDNALGGVALTMSMAQSVAVEGNNRMVIQNFKAGWTELYETWNLAFVCGKVGNSDIMLPKLLIPQVIDAEPKHYLFVRGITLWASAHMLLFYRLNGGGKDPKVSAEMAVISKRWGEINLPYAEAFSLSSTGKKLNENILSRYVKQIWNTFVKGLAQ